MSVKIPIQDYEYFCKKFNADWTNKNEDFYNPIARTIACSNVIKKLVHQEQLHLANYLFEACNAKKAWTATEIPGISSLEKIQEICNKNLNSALDALKKKND